MRIVTAVAAIVSMATAGTAAPRAAPKAFTAPALAVGTAWYPEQWPQDRWEADLALMERANLSVVRIGEFAWSRIEPADGRFDFAWLDTAIAAAARHNMRVVLGTPTAAPPIWLTEAHPDVRRTEEDGRVQGHGERRQFSVASATYRRYAVRIADEMAKRYGHNPAVVGWQIDNEIGLETFDAEAKRRWSEWLARRYGSIEGLNVRWSTDYWSQHYDRFDQVPLTLGRDQNPALVLDAHRFFSAMWVDYVAVQTAAIRSHADRRQFVTTNSTAWNDHFDQHLVHRGLDLAAWDEYVPDGRPDWSSLALHHAVVRGYLRRNFWVMETQPGHVNWGSTNRSLDPGDTRILAWQAIGHGADALLYWQWRSAPGGQEQYHGTLVAADGRPTPIFDEIARTAAEMKRAAVVLAGTVPVARVAMIYSQDSRWAIQQQRFAQADDPVATLKAWYRPFHDRGTLVDVVAPDQDLGPYALVVAPALNVIDRATADRLARFVRRGGHLVLGPRSGLKDGDNALWSTRQPGPLADLLGAQVEAFYALDGPVPVIDRQGRTSLSHVRAWAEPLQVVSQDVKVLARFGDGNRWLEGKPAVVSRTVGAGTITYVGGTLDDAGQAAITERMMRSAGLPTAEPLPSGLEAVERTGAAGRYLLLFNHASADVSWPIPTGGRVLMGDYAGDRVAPKGMVLVELQ